MARIGEYRVYTEAKKSSTPFGETRTMAKRSLIIV